MVVGLADVETGAGSDNPARRCGLREGDIITHINREEVDSIEEVRSILQDLSGESMSIRARRRLAMQMTARAVRCSADGSYKLGAWIRETLWRASAPSPSATRTPGCLERSVTG